MRRPWSFHSVTLVSGTSDEETAAKKELLARLTADTTLGEWEKKCSYRLVGRADLQELVRVTHEEQKEAKRREEKAQEEKEGEQSDPVEGAVDAGEAVEEQDKVVITPALLALAFQRLVSQDKRDFMRFRHTNAAVEVDEGTGNQAGQMKPRIVEEEAVGSSKQIREQTPVRVYLLLDYPASLVEINALLRLGEIGCASQVTDSPGLLPLLPLIDGVVLLADPLASRGRLKNNSTAVQRESVARIPLPKASMSVEEISMFQSCNVVAKTLYEAAQVGGIEWSDFTFTHVNSRANGATTRTSEEIENELFGAVEASAAQKFAFKAWVQSTTFCAIPTLDDDDATNLLRAKYASIFDDVFPGSITVGTVLFAVTEAVAAMSLLSSNTTSHPHCTTQHNRTDSEGFMEHGDLVACRIAGAQLCREALQAEGNPCYLSRGKYRLDDVERAMWRRNDLPGVGNEGRKGMPRVPELTEPERSVCNTELASFYESPRFSSRIVHLTRQLLQVEGALGSSWRGKLQSRAFLEKLSCATLPQRLALVLRQNTPDMYSSYYAPTDSLLLAYLPKTAPGRMQSSFWEARDYVRHRPAFKDWKMEQLADSAYLTPRTEVAAGACVPLSAGQLALVARQTWTMYPADHSVVRLYQTPRGLVWLTVYHLGETFGLRADLHYLNEKQEPHGNAREITEQASSSSTDWSHNVHFIGSFQDDSNIYISAGRGKLSKKPDGFSTITVSNSFPSGLIVSACSDGSIVQRYAQLMPTNKSAARTPNKHEVGDGANGTGVSLVSGLKNGYCTYDCEEEKYRVVYGKGSVLRVLRCGRKEVMLASGIIRVICDCGERHHRSRTDDIELQPPLATTLTLDPETNALVERRPNGVIIVTLTSGARITYHVDGTRMHLNSGGSHILVKKQGLADVCVDVEVNVAAQRHAAGERVAVTKGGLRVRSIVSVYDGTCVEISYNTKVTAQVNGRVTTRKPSGQVIVAKDSGRVEFNSIRPAGDRAVSDVKDDDDRDVINHNGVFYFDCRHGRFELCDNEQNQFHVDLSGSDELPPTVSVDLAGVVSESEAARHGVDKIPAQAVINEPIQPYVFVLNGDGTGIEVLRPQDVAEYVDDSAFDNHVRELHELDPIQHHVFHRQLSPPKSSSQLQNTLFNDEALHEEMLVLQRPVATAAKYLPSCFAESRHTLAQQQFTAVRRIEQIQPLSPDELSEMYTGWEKWEQWQKERETNKDCYKVVDPRQQEAIAQETLMQKKVLAAYKSTRARKKLARQKAREMKAKISSQELSPGLRMETVQEDDEPLGRDGGDEHESDDEFGQFDSDLSDDDVGETVEVDDPMELLWTSFSQADKESRGLLSVAQTRLGVVNALGIGVTTGEITAALVGFKVPHPFNVSFDVFADLVAFFRKGDEDNQDDGLPRAVAANSMPALKGVIPEHRKEIGTTRTAIAAGSAAEAIRARTFGGKYIA